MLDAFQAVAGELDRMPEPIRLRIRYLPGFHREMRSSRS